MKEIEAYIQFGAAKTSDYVQVRTKCLLYVGHELTVFYLSARKHFGRYIWQVVYTLVSRLAGRQLSVTVR